MQFFWTGGFENYLEALKVEFQEHIRVLEERLGNADSLEEIVEIDAEIAARRELYKTRVSQADYSLF